MKLLAQGAEAKIWKSGEKVIKERIRKRYRLREIDERLRKTRTRAEARLLRKAARAGVSVPQVLNVDEKHKVLELEWIEGPKLRDVLQPKMCRKIGQMILKLHRADIVHGDLTASNMILKIPPGGEKGLGAGGGVIYLIDFGLAQHSPKIEDKAVDLHLFKECLKSKHFEIWRACWQEFLKGYSDKEVLKRLEIVERRGRYK